MMFPSKSKFKKESKEVSELKNQLARALADYDNLRKRTERERENLGRAVALGLILRLLSVLDILESTQKHLQDQGLAIAIGEFRRVLAEENLEEINPKKGETFNPISQEAVEASIKGKEGIIDEVLLPGWKFREGEIIRVAKVKVTAKK